MKKEEEECEIERTEVQKVEREWNLSYRFERERKEILEGRGSGQSGAHHSKS